MWLLHSLLILFLINQLIIITYADLAIRGPHLWLPDHPTEDLLPEAKSYWETDAAKSSANCFSSFRSRQKSTSVPQIQAPGEIDPHQLTISYFRKRLQTRNLSTKQKIDLIGKTLRYILRQPSMPEEQKWQWCQEIFVNFDNYVASRALVAIDHIIYAFHTLILQSTRDNLFFSHTITPHLAHFKSKMSEAGMKSAVAQYSQELHYPERGLHQQFLNWDSLYSILNYDPALQLMAMAKNNNFVDVITKNLETLYQQELFSASPKQLLSAQGRVASIALLHHLLGMEHFPDIPAKVKALIKSLIDNTENKFFLFEHEKTLIRNLGSQHRGILK